MLYRVLVKDKINGKHVAPGDLMELDPSVGDSFMRMGLIQPVREGRSKNVDSMGPLVNAPKGSIVFVKLPDAEKQK
ncbi:MAG TPA: hypothetical protein VMW48_03435 [Vicinamibacterales bacterium]|nr:hypothetical protein [Vicinamibacterales bacterium]